MVYESQLKQILGRTFESFSTQIFIIARCNFMNFTVMNILLFLLNTKKTYFLYN